MAEVVTFELDYNGSIAGYSSSMAYLRDNTIEADKCEKLHKSAYAIEWLITLAIP
jgi:hypothetical protein